MFPTCSSPCRIKCSRSSACCVVAYVYCCATVFSSSSPVSLPNSTEHTSGYCRILQLTSNQVHSQRLLDASVLPALHSGALITLEGNQRCNQFAATMLLLLLLLLMMKHTADDGGAFSLIAATPGTLSAYIEEFAVTAWRHWSDLLTAAELISRPYV